MKDISKYTQYIRDDVYYINENFTLIDDEMQILVKIHALSKELEIKYTKEREEKE